MEINNPIAFPPDYPRSLILAGNKWTQPGWYSSGGQQTAIDAARIYYMPIFVQSLTTYDRIGIYVQTGDAAAGVADLRIFRWSSGVPGALLLSAGTVITAALGAKEIVISQALDRGYYFLALRGDQTPSLRGPASSGCVPPVSGIEAVNPTAEIGKIVYSHGAAYTDPAGTPTAMLGSDYAFVRLRQV